MSLGKKKIQMQGAAGIDSTANFLPKLYTGNSSTNAITGVGFQPDLVWIKNRDNANDHFLTDSVRGAGKYVSSNTTGAEDTTSRFNSFDSDGFTVSTDSTLLNNASYDYVAWCWKAGGSAVSNTDGTITSSVSANTDAGFSVVKYTGNGSNGATIGHGLSSAPEMIIIKNLSDSENWSVYAAGSASDNLGETKVGHLNLSNAFSTTGDWNNTAPNSTVFTVGTSNRVNTTDNFVAYCFHSVDGYQKIGSYTGDGTTTKAINVGFEPRFVLIKITSAADNWVIFDSGRDSSNPRDTNLKPNSTAVEANEAGSKLNFTSTGFTLIGSGAGLGQVNSSGGTYLYLAIA